MVKGSGVSRAFESQNMVDVFNKSGVKLEMVVLNYYVKADAKTGRDLLNTSTIF